MRHSFLILPILNKVTTFVSYQIMVAYMYSQFSSIPLSYWLLFSLVYSKFHFVSVYACMCTGGERERYMVGRKMAT